MLLTVDVGNTNTLFGLYASNSDAPDVTLRASSRRDRMPDEWYAILEPGLRRNGIIPEQIDAIVISSVVPGVTEWVRQMGSVVLGAQTTVVRSTSDLGIVVATDSPAEIGTDRIVNSLAARERYGAPAIVIDFGTATNFDIVDKDGRYVGGALSPGLVVALEAMASRAARLFAVELEFPEHALGRNTVHAMQSGLMFGYLSLIEGMIDRLTAEIEGHPTVISTGGLGASFAAHSPLIDHHDEHLTLLGLKLAWENLRAEK
ncbi:MAG: type III pantothenate kinase [Chloroflexota bacterium]|nr:type III pantothenate kinase [Chloroflexota bacterium]